MSRLDVDALLRRAIERDADGHAVELRIVWSDMTRWASATFTGARHELGLTGPSSATAEAWLRALPEADLRMRDHLVADLKVVAVGRGDGVLTATIEVLTVEER